MRVPLPPAAPLEEWPELTLLAAAAWGEARGETLVGQIEVCHTVMERVARGGWFGDGVRGVLLRDTNHDGSPEQYSAFRSITQQGQLEFLKEPLKHDSPMAWENAWHAATAAFFALSHPLFPHATHYHTTGILPSWAKKMRLLGQVGHHVFYTDAKVVVPA